MTELRSDWPQIIQDINGKRLCELADLFAEPASFKGVGDEETIQTDLGNKIHALLRSEAEQLSAGFNGERDRIKIEKVLCLSEEAYAFEGTVSGVGKSGFELTPQNIGVNLSLSQNPDGEGQLIESMEIRVLHAPTQG